MTTVGATICICMPVSGTCGTVLLYALLHVVNGCEGIIKVIQPRNSNHHGPAVEYPLLGKRPNHRRVAAGR
jgi:hypothetical protein